MQKTRRYVLSRARDSMKDQTYALWGVSQVALSKTLFPLGDLTKPEVRAIAARHGLKTATKKKVMKICFVADNDYRRFLRERVPELTSRVRRASWCWMGQVVGKHEGFPNYTLGQRSGIGAHRERVYCHGHRCENEHRHDRAQRRSDAKGNWSHATSTW